MEIKPILRLIDRKQCFFKKDMIKIMKILNFNYLQPGIISIYKNYIVKKI